MRTGKTFFYMLCLLCGWQAAAQELAMPEGLSADGKEGRYVDKAGNQALIYTGELEPSYLNRLEGHPYLDTREYRKGTLAFDEVVYPGVEMRLNVYMERLIVLSPDRRLHVIVPPERIRFVRLPDYDLYYMEPKGEKGYFPEGFYVRLYAGKYALWKRSTKGLERRMEELTLTDRFVEKTSYYIEKDGVYYPVSGKRSLLHLFKENKDELKRYMKERNLSFGDERERSLIRVVEYCETLNLR
ncbi:hypothetical protein [Parabacteroides sp.]